MTDTPNRPPLWRVMKKAWETTTTDYDGSYAAEIRAIVSYLKEHGAGLVDAHARALLDVEADRAERGE